MTVSEIFTTRLRLVPATPDIARAELEGSAAFAALLAADVPAGWPPPLNDHDSMTFFLGLAESSPGWGAWYFVLGKDLIGNGGFKGPPDADGVVEIGYSIIPEHHRRGFASEAMEALIRWAFSHGEVSRVVAHTFPNLAGSIGVLARLGFRPAGEGEEAGTIRFELVRL